MKSFKTAKGTELPLLDLKGKSYLQVPHRIMWCREEHPEWLFEVIFPILDDKMVMARAVISDENGRIRAVAHKTEHFAHFTDAIEKAESSAIGRALAHLGYGTQFALELDEHAHKVVDAPISPKAQSKPSLPNNTHNRQDDADMVDMPPMPEHMFEEPEPPPKPPTGNIRHSTSSQYALSDKQIKRLWAIARSREFSPSDVMKLIKGAGVNDPESLSKASYDEICTFMEKNKPDEDQIPF